MQGKTTGDNRSRFGQKLEFIWFIELRTENVPKRTMIGHGFCCQATAFSLCWFGNNRLPPCTSSKKIVGFFATPLVFCSGLQLLGLWFLFRDRKRLGLILGATGVGLLTVLSVPFVGERLMGSLESHDAVTMYQPATALDRNTGFVVVLSGGFHPFGSILPCFPACPGLPSPPY